MQVLQRMVLADLKLPVDQLVAKEADGLIDQRPCLHWLLNRDLFSLSENVSTDTGTYPCCPESGNFLTMVV